MVGSIYNRDGWIPVYPAIQNCKGYRTKDRYLEALKQFEVATNPRYAARGASTWCNVFVWDATLALCCEIPHWWLGKELNANGVYDWLARNGANYGWKRCSESEARAYANQGRPTVVAWKNTETATSSGHIAMVLPEEIPGVTLIAQAGKTNFFGRPLSAGFGRSNACAFFTHE